MNATFSRDRLTQLTVAVGLALSAGTAWSGSAVFAGNAGFAQGATDGVVINGGKVVLGTVGSTFDLLWVANAGDDTVSKIDTKNNVELARYRTWFDVGVHSAWGGPAPSRTAVDSDGNVFVANRHFDGKPARLMKILATGGIDRNNNGVIDTSTGPTDVKALIDTNGNDALDAAELSDERVAWSVPVGNPGGLGRAACIGTDGNVWVGLYSHQAFYKVNASSGAIMSGPHSVPWTPYGCAVDRNGILWSASLGQDLGRLDTNNPSNAQAIYIGNTYGIAIGNNKVYLGGNCSYYEYDPANPTNILYRNGQCGAGISVDGSGDIVTGSSQAAKYSKVDGSEKWVNSSNPSSYAVGVVVDGDNNVWQVDLYGNRVTKFDGATGNYLATLPVGDQPYTYSDATGIAARNQTSHTGFWSIILDGGPNAKWYKVCWSANVPNGAAVGAESRADNVQGNLGNQNFAARGNCTPLLQEGRYLELRAKLTANVDDVTPELLQIAAQTRPCDVDNDNDVDSADIAAIRANLNKPASGFGDPRDADGNNVINLLDVRACTQQCTRAGCATN